MITWASTHAATAAEVVTSALACCRCSRPFTEQKSSAEVAATLPEVGNAWRFFANDAGIVLVRRASRLTLEHHRGIRPDRHPSAAAAAFLIAHDVAPLGAVDIAVTIGERGHDLVHTEIMARTDDVTDLVR